MTSRGHHRGHQMWFDESAQEWRYKDDDTIVHVGCKMRPCGHCGELATEDGHDPCISNLPGVMNACCGHGQDKGAYVQLLDGHSLIGESALTVMAELKKAIKVDIAEDMPSLDYDEAMAIHERNIKGEAKMVTDDL